jgi:gamma-glutamylcyclotransferase (GGCT)/AIG2-like uncharacterized protein YtfP
MNKDKKKVLFFVYGTLMSGYGNNVLLQKAELLGEHETDADFTMHSLGGFPCVTLDGKTSIKGEVYATTDENIIQNVYRLEGFSGTKNSRNNWYDMVDVETPYGTAGMFVMLSPKYKEAPIVPTGSWRNRTQNG